MFDEDELLPISALQHLAFCPRQCALIHIERLWAENRLTAEGRILHERVDSGESSNRETTRTLRGASIRSLELGLTGRIDVLELRQTEEGEVVPFPVEYKRGRPKAEDWDEVQLCAQAMCVEEMMGLEVPGGALFYASTRRRRDVSFTEHLRARVEELARDLRTMVKEGITPPPVVSTKCQRCSLVDRCLPAVAGDVDDVWNWMVAAVKEQAGR
jgi:CRISPR-associated exonuclease Cas4